MFFTQKCTYMACLSKMIKITLIIGRIHLNLHCIKLFHLWYRFLAKNRTVASTFKPQGGVLWYFHTYVGSAYFLGGSKFWISIFFGVFRKMNIFGGYEDFVDIFCGHHKIGLVWGLFLCSLGSFYKVKVQNWDIFGGC